MHISGLFHRWLANACPWMHAMRREVLKAVVVAAMRGTQLTVTGLGRSIRSEAREKHCIKRADRLLSKLNLQAQCFDVCQAQARRILGAVQRPVVIVDWSNLDKSQTLFLLRASTLLGGPSLTLYEEVPPPWTQGEAKGPPGVSQEIAGGITVRLPTHRGHGCWVSHHGSGRRSASAGIGSDGFETATCWTSPTKTGGRPASPSTSRRPAGQGSWGKRV